MAAQSVHGGHVYEFDGIKYPSVTTILSDTADPDETRGLDSWRRNFSMPGFRDAEEYVSYTAVRGTLVHFNVLNSVVKRLTPMSLDSSDLPNTTEWFNRLDRISAEIKHCRKLWEDLALKIELPMSAESAGYHPEMMYAGTKDLHAKIDGVKTILDLKTSSQIRDKHLTQVAAYVQMECYWRPSSVERGMIVSLNPGKKKAMVKIIEGNDLDMYIDDFNERLKAFYKIPSVRKEYGL